MGSHCSLWAWVCLCILVANGGQCGSAASWRRPRFPHHAHWVHGHGGQSAGVTYTVEHFTQVIDHFSFRREGGFQQRYLIEQRYWKGAAEKGPIFMYCGNEGDVEWFAKNSGFLWEIAPAFGALILVPEVSDHFSNYVPNFCSGVPRLCFRI
jgi:lysosomal Pro-X carboxypeptidase